jgi:saccharopine dehydrogenase-like NADP-dependent oxidoreductase
MHRVLVVGAGKIGSLISGLLVESRSYHVDLANVDIDAAHAVAAQHGLGLITPYQVDATDAAALAAYLKAHPVSAVISALPFHCNRRVAEVCRDQKVHYFDLTEDVETTQSIMAIAADANTAFVPQCGLAPGFISIVGNELIGHFDEVHEVKLRVGALPQTPSNALKYALTWSTEGIINEYGNPCYGLVDGAVTQMQPLEGLETIQLDGQLYEAFNTSGGLGSLAETHRGAIRDMTYKTIRYPGHCEAMRLLMFGLKLNEDRPTLKRILENALPRTLQDVVLIYVSVVGKQDGELREENLLYKVYPQEIGGRVWGAIQVTTAAGLTAVVDLILSDATAYKGFVRQEQFSLASILDNRFGKCYSAGSTTLQPRASAWKRERSAGVSTFRR